MTYRKMEHVFRTHVDHHSMMDVLRHAYRKGEASQSMTVEELVLDMRGQLQSLLSSEEPSKGK
ncbi:hypothetical protein [Aureibacillus halotolerans]|uniref:Uncharacterized protein n=1 Tax=Aureibacillus halotolerans TaxID=1508390 RepID=A0A4R6TRD6_9BACI|nr:hypothetical protein [Aureibacillus halotolerans]TDQ36128.1 hypothetical protein EV213_12059 [Aureibacillus halotolerans]